MEKALDSVKNLRFKGDKSAACITLREGVYKQTSTINISEVYTGEYGKGLTIKAYQDEKVRLNAGIDIPAEELVDADNGFKSKIIDQTASGNVKMINLKNLGITDYGEISRRGHMITEGKLAQMEVSVDGKKQRLARWPNENFVGYSEVVESGTRTQAEIKNGCAFKTDYDRPSLWADPSIAWVGGVLSANFQYDYYPVGSVEKDAADKTIVRLREGAIQDYYTKHYFIYENIPEELDAPGEYFIDRGNGILYIYPPEGASKITLSMMKEDMIRLDNASNVRFENIEFEGGRKSAITGANSNLITIKGCTIHGFGEHGISFSATNSLTVRDGEVYDVGKHGIYSVGGNYNALIPSNNLIYNNNIHDFSNLERSYTAGVVIGYQSVGTRVERNHIYNAPHTGLIFYGCNNVIGKNELNDLVLEFQDMDSVYANNSEFPWERGNRIERNYFHDIGNQRFNGERQINVRAIRTDNEGHGLTVMGNIFHHIGLGGTTAVAGVMAQGTHNTVSYNMFVDCSETYISFPTYKKDFQYEEGTKKYEYVLALEKKIADNPIYATSFPELLNFRNEHYASAKTNEFNSNLIVNIEFPLSTVMGSYDPEGFRGAHELVAAEENYLTAVNPGFVDYENGNFELNKNSTALQKIPNFPVIEFDTIGVFMVR